jgi:hypothetical protein
MSLVQTLGPPVSLDGPIPVIRPYRLIDIATVIDDPDPHWRAGAQIWPYPPDLPGLWVACPDGTSQGDKAAGDGWDIPVFNAFQVYLPITCSSLSVGDDWEEYVRRATLAFNARESHGVEQAFSQGLAALATQPYLADANADVLATGAATNPTRALNYLERAIGETGQGGVIHATPDVVSAWESTGFTLDKSGTKLLTRANGTPVVSGTGYICAQPVGHTAPGAHTAWAFATGPVQLRRGDLDIVPGSVAQALDRANNVVTYRAERDELVDWDQQLQAAILVDWTI